MRINLEQFLAILGHLQQEPSQPVAESSLGLALVALLYAERKIKPFFEYLAESLLTQRLDDDAKLALFAACGFAPADASFRRKVGFLIRYHKLATQVLGGRLGSAVGRHILAEADLLDVREALALVAAAAYDTPHEGPDETVVQRARVIFDGWRQDPPFRPATRAAAWSDRVAILYDLPLCQLDPHHRRQSYDPKRLETFLDFLQPAIADELAQTAQPLIWATFHYQQARQLEFQDDLAGKTPELLRHKYEIHRVQVCGAEGSPAEVHVYEFRAKGILPAASQITFIQTNPQVTPIEFLGLPGAKSGSAQFSPAEVRDAAGLERRLARRVRPIDGLLADALATWRSAASNQSVPLPDALVAVLNQLVEAGSLLSGDLASDPELRLRSVTRHLHRQVSSSGSLVSPANLNRLVLEDAYPVELQRRGVWFAAPMRDYLAHPWVADQLRKYADLVDEAQLDAIRFRFQGRLDEVARETDIIQLPKGLKRQQPGTGTPEAFADEYLIVEKHLAATATNRAVTAGADRITIEGRGDAAGLAASVRSLLADKEAGFWLWIRFAEQYMRSHEVTVSGDYGVDPADHRKLLRSLREGAPLTHDAWSVGIDIGATSIKLTLFDPELQARRSIQMGTAKDPGKADAKYATLAEFARRLMDHVWSLLQADDVKHQTVQVVAVTWPGPVRDNKVGGASRILGEFDKEIANKLIRVSTVEQIRNLDLVKEMRLLWHQRFSKAPITIVLTNDGYAEGMGWLLHQPEALAGHFTLGHAHRWAVLKLGTGTAGCLIWEGHPQAGPKEFGKLMVNDHDQLKLRKVGLDQTPFGDVNKVASQNLYPAVFREVVTPDEQVEVTSYEIAQLTGFYASGAGDVARLLCDLGENALYHDMLQNLVPAADFHSLVTGASVGQDRENIAWRVEKALHVNRSQLLDHCRAEGATRLGSLLYWLARDAGDPRSTELNQTRNHALLKTVLKAKVGEDALLEVLDRAGALLADVVMLIRGIYPVDGVILCGGVLREPWSTTRVVRSIGTHLRHKYHIEFADYAQYRRDSEPDVVRRFSSANRLYHNFLPDPERQGVFKSVAEDQAERGAVLHGWIMRSLEAEPSVPGASSIP